MRYRVDLKAFMACCEANYFRLLQLFPDISTENRRRIGLSHGDVEVELLVLERTPYTTLVSIAQKQLGADDEAVGTRSERTDKSVTVCWFKPPMLTVRLYHDAQIAEVITYDRNRGVFPKNAYPNKQMFQPDEKRQWNNFLEEWLVVCSQHGYAVGESVPMPDTTCE